MSSPTVSFGVVWLLAIAGGAHAQERAAQESPTKPANAWMKIPTDLSSPDDLPPYLRSLRDEYWDGQLGQFGVLTPQTAIQTSGEDTGPSFAGDPEIPDLGKNEAALIGTFIRYRSVLTASGRAVYTEVTFKVDRVFQDAVRGHALPGTEITVCLRGGTVRTVDGRVISYLTDPLEYFMQPGRAYLLLGMYYTADGDFYESGTPQWELADGLVRPNFSEARAKLLGRNPALIGRTKEDLIRSRDERFARKVPKTVGGDCHVQRHCEKRCARGLPATVWD